MSYHIQTRAQLNSQSSPSSLGLNGIFSHRKMRRLLLLLLRDSASILLTQPSPDRSCLFRSEIERKVLLLSVEFAQLSSLVGADDGEDAGYGFAEVVSGWLSVLRLAGV
jgi:hypothetical protein